MFERILLKDYKRSSELKLNDDNLGDGQEYILSFEQVAENIFLTVFAYNSLSLNFDVDFIVEFRSFIQEKAIDINIARVEHFLSRAIIFYILKQIDKDNYKELFLLLEKKKHGALHFREREEYKISVSHSVKSGEREWLDKNDDIFQNKNSLIAVAISLDGTLVGVDVEALIRRKNLQSLINYMFSERERKIFANLSNTQNRAMVDDEEVSGKRLMLFFSLWTRYEALCKLLEIGILKIAKSFPADHNMILKDNKEIYLKKDCFVYYDISTVKLVSCIETILGDKFKLCLFYNK